MSLSLLSDYFALEAEGYNISTSIDLVGADMHLLKTLANYMKDELQQLQRFDVTVDVYEKSRENCNARYVIDAGYFLRLQSSVSEKREKNIARNCGVPRREARPEQRYFRTGKNSPREHSAT